MTEPCVRVWVDRYGSYELAGTIEMHNAGLSFVYDPSFRRTGGIVPHKRAGRRPEK